MALAIYAYARARKSEKNAAQEALKVRLQAERRAGELLDAFPKRKRYVNSATLAELKIDPHESSRWQRFAHIPSDYFDELVSRGTSRSSILQIANGLSSSGNNVIQDPPVYKSLGELVKSLQRTGNCPSCGYWDPFHPSWYTPEKEVAEPHWVQEWDNEIFTSLQKFRDITIEHCDGDWVYHLTRNDRTVERWPISVDVLGFSPQQKGDRK